MEWISVRDRLPEEMANIIATDGMNVEVGFRSCIDDPEYTDEWLDFHFIVTHWIPLPELPEP